MNQDSSENDVVNLRDAQTWNSLPLGDSVTRAKLVAWLRESPANVRAFLMDCMLSVELGNLDFAGESDLEKLIASAMQRMDKEVPTTEDPEV